MIFLLPCDQRYQEYWSQAIYGFLFSWFTGQWGQKISCTKSQTLPNSRIPDTSACDGRSCRFSDFVPVLVIVVRVGMIDSWLLTRYRDFREESQRSAESSWISLFSISLVSQNHYRNEMYTFLPAAKPSRSYRAPIVSFFCHSSHNKLVISPEVNLLTTS